MAVRISRDAGGGVAAARRAAADRADAAAGRLPAEGAARGPARHRLPVRADRPAGRAGRPLHRARPRRQRARWCRWTGRRARTPRPSWPGVVTTPTERHPEGVTRVVLLGDPTKSLGALSEPECARVIAALDLAERMARAGRVVRAVVGRADLDDLRHREHGLGGRRAQADRRVHPGRRRDQHRGRRDQRRRPAVLERRGHDAHAHQGHPGDDAGLGDGAHRQAVAGLLRRRVGRGQLRHRRLRPGDGARTARRSTGRRTCRPPATS